MDRQGLEMGEAKDKLEDPNATAKELMEVFNASKDRLKEDIAAKELAIWVFQNVKIHPYSKIPKFLSWFFPIGAITIGRNIFVKGDYPSHRLTRHEFIHVAQQKEMGMLNFMLRYFYYWLIGLYKKGNPYEAYLSIPFEREAYDNEMTEGYLFDRRPHSWREYV